MSKFMTFTQGHKNTRLAVNMDQVCHIMPNGDAHGGSILTFSAVIDGCPAYLVVNESFGEIAMRRNWSNV
jgi:hypothetical protein